MSKSIWTEKQLKRPFNRYNRKYWDGNLPDCAVKIGRIRRRNKDEEIVGGSYNRKTGTITIDVKSILTDKKVVSVLLHEMCHVATQDAESIHGKEFLSQMDMLIRRKAPLQISFGDTPDLLSFGLALSTDWFPALKQKMLASRHWSQTFDAVLMGDLTKANLVEKLKTTRSWLTNLALSRPLQWIERGGLSESSLSVFKKRLRSKEDLELIAPTIQLIFTLIILLVYGMERMRAWEEVAKKYGRKLPRWRKRRAVEKVFKGVNTPRVRKRLLDYLAWMESQRSKQE